jgi:hypothetical protein
MLVNFIHNGPLLHKPFKISLLPLARLWHLRSKGKNSIRIGNVVCLLAHPQTCDKKEK